ncbi:hypothetical protein PPL_06332 [Heterostelium album PN500]|uniref:Uncharacterized protein n=1 Tax=Heterostelium pallidum (strain ATCC 26659 / Pp 5 / PN500) TaxID=670386 RepID=D3BCV4_HETP5|nr:hypothetical protein PPL_06332 [Heterostelium album PN500]EFA80746.1 hypothetical protein PPL_06332 [Heterostelium album PN500]|eukprot:XP_020432866.1 hypothetical protein PPL_06332 [Heterostelium album PN500]
MQVLAVPMSRSKKQKRDPTEEEILEDASMIIPKSYVLDIDTPLPGQTNYFEIQLCLYRVFNRKSAHKLKSFFTDPTSTFSQLDSKITNMHQDNLDKFMKKFTDVGSAVSKIPMPPVTNSLQVLSVVPDIIQLGANTKEMLTLQPLLWETTRVCGSINNGEYTYNLEWGFISQKDNITERTSNSVSIPWMVKKRYTACPRHSMVRHKKNGSTILQFSVTMIDNNAPNSRPKSLPLLSEPNLQKIFGNPNDSLKKKLPLTHQYSQEEMHLSELSIKKEPSSNALPIKQNSNNNTNQNNQNNTNVESNTPAATTIQFNDTPLIHSNSSSS